MGELETLIQIARDSSGVSPPTTPVKPKLQNELVTSSTEDDSDDDYVDSDEEEKKSNKDSPSKKQKTVMAYKPLPTTPSKNRLTFVNITTVLKGMTYQQVNRGDVGLHCLNPDSGKRCLAPVRGPDSKHCEGKTPHKCEKTMKPLSTAGTNWGFQEDGSSIDLDSTLSTADILGSIPQILTRSQPEWEALTAHLSSEPRALLVRTVQTAPNMEPSHTLYNIIPTMADIMSGNPKIHTSHFKTADEGKYRKHNTNFEICLLRNQHMTNTDTPQTTPSISDPHNHQTHQIPERKNWKI